ncbi:MAG: hypothetical protein Q8N76_01460 [Candidatus Omnitrophota bacterium]|nr:hypothetical protein [Candidatus Omnitrophota bacterium]
MIKFETAYFGKFDFTEEQITQFLNNALKDLEIAKENSRSEVKFSYSYSAFIKGGIALLAKVGKVKIRGIPGHHVKVIEKMKEILKDETVEIIGNAMRSKRNEDFYGGGVLISEKESKDYYVFVEKVLVIIKGVLK